MAERGLASIDVDTRSDWLIKLEDEAKPSVWDWGVASPPVRQIRPVRDPATSAKQRHIVVLAFAVTTRSSHLLESGLEHDLLRQLDRDPEIDWIVAQPFQLQVAGIDAFKHIPDLLSQDRSGQVTVWDARPLDRQDAKFARAAAYTADACRDVGWQYQVFAGFNPTERLNRLWLHSSRQAPRWLDEYSAGIVDVLSTRPRTLGELFDQGADRQRAKAVVWHLMWRGTVWADLTQSINERTQVVLAGHDA